MNRLIADGYQVLALSTCTSIDRYNRDDRMVALRMAKYVNDSENFHIAMDELNDVEIGKILASCVLNHRDAPAFRHYLHEFWHTRHRH